MFSPVSILGLASGLAAVANAHTTFTTAFINGENQGDGVCVRMPTRGSTATYPIDGISSNDMVCGRDGTNPVPFTCSAPQGSTISFWWREWPDYTERGAIDPSHMGSCAVYVKQVSNAAEESGAGDGWFKIWDEGYDSSSRKWCTDKLIDNQGFLSVALPSGLPTGDYLIRPEILALHESTKGDPQFYVGCLQLHVSGSSEGRLEVPSQYTAAIPGYVNRNSNGLVFDVWNKNGDSYTTSGPDVYFPTSSSGIHSSVDGGYEGIPSDCLVANGNWCGVEVPSYSSESGCWAASQNCWNQADTCYSQARPMGHANCDVWSSKCSGIERACTGRNYNGPPNQGARLSRVDAEMPRGVSLSAWSSGSISGGGGNAPNVVPDSPETVDDGPVETEEPTVVATTSPEPTEPAENPDYEEEEEEEQEEEEEEEEATATSSGSTAEPTDVNLKVSEDGMCGGSTGQTCEGSEFGNCCSKKGRCGSTRRHCSCGCLGGFGECYKVRSSMYVVEDEYNEDY